MRTTVQVGGVLSDHKGLNLPGAILPMSALTTKIAPICASDWMVWIGSLCPSFSGRRILRKRAGLSPDGGHPLQMEKPAAIEHLEQIVQLTDAIMVARGDLGVEAPPKMYQVCKNESFRPHGRRANQ